jgi:predicted amidophosphoribosyltransferase
VLKSLYFKLLECLEPCLDAISARKCYFCANADGYLICEQCLIDKVNFKKKIIDYKTLDLFFQSYEQVFHPSIFYLVDFFKQTSFLIKKAKYSRPHYSKFIAKILCESFIDNLIDVFTDANSLDISEELEYSNRELKLFICSVPMYLNKKKQRGFNLSELLAKDFFLELSSKKECLQNLILQTKYGFEKFSSCETFILPDFFLRVKDTKALYNLKQKQRAKELKNAFAVNSLISTDNKDLNVLLIIDDICTTGSTLMELMKLARSTALFEDEIALSIYGRNLK